MQSDKILKVIGIAFDVIFSIALLTFIASCWWMYLDDRNSLPPYNGTGTPFFVMLRAGGPFIFSVPWLWLRLGPYAMKKFPTIIGPYMQTVTIVLLIAIGLPVYLITKLGK